MMINHLLCLAIPLMSVFVLQAVGNPVREPDCQPSVACTTVSDCGKTGCCLNGTCSRTGLSFDKCYMNIQENGKVQYVGVWTKTDICPCDYTYYCLKRSKSNQVEDPTYGDIGFCNPIMG